MFEVITLCSKLVFCQPLRFRFLAFGRYTDVENMTLGSLFQLRAFDLTFYRSPYGDTFEHVRPLLLSSG